VVVERLLASLWSFEPSWSALTLSLSDAQWLWERRATIDIQKDPLYTRENLPT
jgi:hypothetical protein